MPAIRLRHVHRFRDRHGRVRHYLRLPGCKAISLPGEPGSPEFMAAYITALPKEKEERAAPGSLDALAISFYRSAAFCGLGETTQAPYRRIVEEMRRDHGGKPVRLLNRAAVAKLMQEKAAHPTAANHRLRLLRLLMRHAVALGWREDDPTADVERHTYRTEGYATWSEAEIAAYRAKHPAGSVARLAFELLLNTGQRRSDVMGMGPQHVRNGAIHIRQIKTKEPVAIPILPALAAELALIQHKHLTWLALPNGTSRSPRGFYNSFRGWCDDAGIAAGRSPHGLRKACGVRLAEAGCTAHEIMSILGHRTLAEAQRYTAQADRRRMAEEAMRKVARLVKE